MTDDFIPTANTLTSGNADIDRRIALATPIAEAGLAKGFIPESTFMHAASAEECDARIDRWFKGDSEEAVYARINHPNGIDLKNALSVLEDNTRFARATSTGMAGIRAGIFGSVKAGDHIVASRHLFGATTSYLKDLKNYGIETTFIDGRDPDEWRKAMKDNTRLFFFETPANPLLHLIDVKEVSKIAHERDIIVAVDGSMVSSLPQQILKDGADALFLSITKYVSGGLYTGGMVLISEEGAERYRLIDPAANDPDKDKYRVIANLSGGDSLSAAPAYHFLGQIAKLGENFGRYSDNAHELAAHLEKQGINVLYPGLKTHPQFDLAQRQMLKRGDGSVFGGAVFTVDCGDKPTAFRVINQLIQIADVSPETNFAQPRGHATYQAGNTYKAYTPEMRADVGITDGHVRFSPGLADPQRFRDGLDAVVTLIHEGQYKANLKSNRL